MTYKNELSAKVSARDHLWQYNMPLGDHSLFWSGFKCWMWGHESALKHDFCLIILLTVLYDMPLWECGAKVNPLSLQELWVWVWYATFTLSPSQFYRCFLILFHCNHWSAENGNTSMASKTTAIQLNRRVCSNAMACTVQISTDALNQCCSTPAIKNTSPPEVTTWTWKSSTADREHCHDEAWITSWCELQWNLYSGLGHSGRKCILCVRLCLCRKRSSLVCVHSVLMLYMCKTVPRNKIT